MIYPIEPIFNYRIWGGDFLKASLNRSDIEGPIGEVFLVSAMPEFEADSIIDGMGLQEFYEKHPEYFGLKVKHFPLRVNLIEAKDNLSVQLHPKKENLVNSELPRGVEEVWYVVDAEENSELVLGINSSNIDDIKRSITEDKWESILCSLPAKKGDFAFLPAGSVHAIGKGCLIYEVTYNVDITYRLYDYNRVDKKTGKKRDLHHKEGLDNLNLEDKIELINTAKGTTIIDQNTGFKIEKISCKDTLTIEQDSFYFYTIIRGQGTINGMNTTLFGTYLVPKQQLEIELIGDFELLRVTYKE